MRIVHLSMTSLALAALALTGAAAATATGPLTVSMNSQNGSGETGTATLTQVSGGVQVVVTLKGAPATAQPAHIHPGTCAKLNPAPKYPLTNVTNGSSTTLVKGVTIADLLASSFAINVHKSTTDLATYVSCGNIAAKPASSSM